MKTTIKAKIIKVSGETKSYTEKSSTRRVVMSVCEKPADNIYGHTQQDKNPFDVEVYNHNIDTFNISPQLEGGIGILELNMTPTSPTQFRCIVNDLTFRL